MDKDFTQYVEDRFEELALEFVQKAEVEDLFNEFCMEEYEEFKVAFDEYVNGVDEDE